MEQHLASLPAKVVRYRRMGLGDLDAVVTQHATHFPDNPMSRLGTGFLNRYYRTFLDGPHAAAAVAVSEDGVMGFVVGVLDTVEHRRLLRRYHGRSLAASALAAGFAHPTTAGRIVWHRLWVTLSRLRNSVTHSSPVERVAVLSHLAVAVEGRGLGIGTAMVEAFLRDCSQAGATRVCVATGAGELGAGGLYGRLGFRLVRERDTFDGRRIELYEMRLGFAR